jgi:multidrug transporter EmrE-like cation transporter
MALLQETLCTYTANSVETTGTLNQTESGRPENSKNPQVSLWHLGISGTSSKIGVAQIMTERPKNSVGLHLKTYILILFIAVFAPMGNVLLGKGMRGIGSANNWDPGQLLHILGRILTSGYIWLGITCLLAFFISYMLILTWADYSYVQPASSFSYAVVAVLGYLMLGEAISPLRWIGIAVICVGVFIVGHTHPQTTESSL